MAHSKLSQSVILSVNNSVEIEPRVRQVSETSALLK